MPEKRRDKLPHIVVRSTSTKIAYKARPGGGSATSLPKIDRAVHGSNLKAQLAKLAILAKEAEVEQRAVALQSGVGLQIQFASFADVAIAFESLSNERGKDASKRIELLSVSVDANRTSSTLANVFVPEGKLEYFQKYVAEYLSEKKNKLGDLIDHSALLNSIQEIRPSQMRGLWTDDPEFWPTDKTEQFWWEVWLPVRGSRALVVSEFKRLMRLANCEVSQHQIDFPERTVVLMFGSENQLSSNSMVLNCIAELRRAKESASFFDLLPPLEQLDWVNELQKRIVLPSDDDKTPRICLLDTGVNRGHPLLEPLMSSLDLHSVDPAWGVADDHGHGTGLASLAALGDLSSVLDSEDDIEVLVRLESVKLLREEGSNIGDDKFFGYLFAEGVSRPEVVHPHRLRVFTSSVTSSDGRDRGRPSAWSAKVDGLASDDFNQGKSSRLIVLSAGNIRNPGDWSLYPASLATNQIQDPAQAWNALTVGAFTEKAVITEADSQHYSPIAASGELSPFSTTSVAWDNDWPFKPDVVFEGGNAAKDKFGAANVTSLSLLTTHHLPQERSFATSNATSAASALCAGMAGRLMAKYPNLRAETIRALIVQSANWTPAMRAAHLPHKPLKSDFARLIRFCGWGVPDESRTFWSEPNSLTLIVEDELAPFMKPAAEPVQTNEMHVHKLPWPKYLLEELPPETQVEMRVTLSYFVEPNPSARGEKSKFHYPSHRLRFDVQRALDSSTEQFVARLNAAAKLEDKDEGDETSDGNWLLGKNQRYKGSLHNDIWQGTAAELANRGYIAVYPANGWWRTRNALNRYDSKAKYSLIVSLATPNTDIDLYTPIANMLSTTVETVAG
jgi:Subtilase family